jgi:excisionase family DNA binding protein
MDESFRRELVSEGLLTVRASAAFLGVSIAALYQKMGTGSLPYVKIGRSRRIPRRALVEFAAKRLNDRPTDQCGRVG